MELLDGLNSYWVPADICRPLLKFPLI
jgi:hypothetical protein